MSDVCHRADASSRPPPARAARNDILSLARDNAYSQLPLDNITVSQALQYLKAAGPGQQVYPGAPEATHRRCYTCTRADTLRTVMETLALPSVSRLARPLPGPAPRRSL